MRTLLLLVIFAGAFAEEPRRDAPSPTIFDTFEDLQQQQSSVINAWVCGRLYTGQLWCVQRQYGSRVMDATPFGAPVRWRSIVGQ